MECPRRATMSSKRRKRAARGCLCVGGGRVEFEPGPRDGLRCVVQEYDAVSKRFVCDFSVAERLDRNVRTRAEHLSRDAASFAHALFAETGLLPMEGDLAATERGVAFRRPWEVLPVQGKGLGMVAFQHIKAGEIVLSDEPLLTVPGVSPEADFPILAHQMRAFSDDNFRQFWKLCPSDGSILELAPTSCPSSRLEIQHEIDKFASDDPTAKDEDWWVFDLMFDILEQNSFGAAGMEQSPEHRPKLLFALASRINHSCEPNCAKRTYVESSLSIGTAFAEMMGADPQDPGGARVTHGIEATRDIAPGEEITISYLAGGDFEHANTMDRQAELQRCWKFMCACEGCRPHAPR